jgi:hypothetical protein
MKKTFFLASGIGVIFMSAYLLTGKVEAIVLKPTKNAIKEEIKDQISTKPGVLKKVKMMGTKVTIGSGKILSKGTSTLTVEKDTKPYTVNIDSRTQLRRRFWGKATLDEMQPGDNVNVIGKWADEAQTSIQALLVRDASIQKRNGVFFGTVATITGNSITVNTQKRGLQTLTVSTSTKYTSRNNQKIVLADILTGHKIRFRGLWDSTANTVTEITQVVDFNLPALTTPTPKK